MKTIWRLLSYARPLNFYLPQFFLYTFLGVVFGLLNLTLLKPLFDIIFNQIDPELLTTYSSKPVFNANFEFLIHAFYYYAASAGRDSVAPIIIGHALGNVAAPVGGDSIEPVAVGDAAGDGGIVADDNTVFVDIVCHGAVFYQAVGDEIEINAGTVVFRHAHIDYPVVICSSTT